MKTLIKYFCLFLFIGSIFSCEDEDKNQFQLFDESTVAPFVNILLSKTLIGKTAPLAEEVITATVNAPGGNVESWNLRVRVVGSVTTGFVDVMTVNTFPSDISLTTVELANLTGISLDDLEPADAFEFSANSVGTDGFVLTADQLAPDLGGQPEQNQAYDFSFILFCSPAGGVAEGDWTLDLVDRFGDGWDGAFIGATIDGVDTTYTIDSGSSAQHIVNVPVGSLVIWTYTQGAFEEEHVWTMTGPDGTVYGPFDGDNDIDFCFF